MYDFRLEITKDVITKRLNNLNINKSPGPDRLHQRVNRTFKDYIEEKYRKHGK